MERRDFLKMSGIGLGVLLAPACGRAIAAEELLTRLDAGLKKRLADTAMTAAKEGGASYCDVRIGRYLRQFLMTREDKVRAIGFLNDNGAFLVTKAGQKVCTYFGISKYTLYNYLDEAKQGRE